VIVPRVRGKPLAQAERIIRHARLKVGKVQQVTDSAVAAGDVSSTNPFAGEPEPPGTTVEVFVSTGPPLKTVPSVTGQTEATARAILESAGFSVAVSTNATNSAPAGTVISQSPPGGTQVTPGSTVSIVVAEKPTPQPTSATVPGVTGQPEAAAKSSLGAAGFSVNVSTQTVTSKSKNGIVLSQTPAGGTKAKKGSTVTIVVGNYKQPTTPTTPTTTSTTPGSGRGGSGGGGPGSGGGGSGGGGGGGGGGRPARVQ
jgi:beta-lactam-binding protein with PASTA domain